MILNVVMAVTLRYLTEFGNPAFQHIAASARNKIKFMFVISSADKPLVYTSKTNITDRLGLWGP